MHYPLRAETIERISQAQTPVPPASLEERAAILRDLISRKCGNDRMLAGWQQDLQKILDEIEAGEAMKTNPGRTFGNVTIKSFLEIFDEAGNWEFDAAEAVKDVYPEEYKLVKQERGKGITDFYVQRKQS
jgi:hypothetical protein